jgi:hypothetical protein
MSTDTARQRKAAGFSAGVVRGIEAFFAWWKAGLTDLVPRPIRQLFVARRVYIWPVADGLEYGLSSPEDNSRIRAVALDFPKAKRRARKLARKTPVILYLPEAFWLEQQLDLPNGQVEALPTLLTHGLESLSPFHPSEVHVAAAASKQKRGSLAIRYALRTKTDPVLETMKTLTILPDAIWLGSASHAIDLSTRKSRRIRLFDRLALGLIGLAAILGVAAIVQVYIRSIAERDALATRIAGIESRFRAAAADNERKNLDLVTGRRIAEAFAQRPVFTPLLASFASRLDETMRFSAIDLGEEGLRATIVIRSARDPAPLLTGGRLVPGLAIDSIERSDETSYVAAVHATAGSLRSAEQP